MERVYKIIPPTGPTRREYELACKKTSEGFANLFMCHAHELVSFDMQDGKPPRTNFTKVYSCETSAEKVIQAWRDAKNLCASDFAATIQAILWAMDTGVEYDCDHTGYIEGFESVIKHFQTFLESHAKGSDTVPDEDASMTGYWIINNPMLVAGVAMVVKIWVMASVEDSLGQLLAGQADRLKWVIEDKMKKNFQPFLEANIRHYWANK